MIPLALLAGACALLAPDARASDQRTIRLNTGERLSVEILGTDGGLVRFRHPTLGELSVDATKIVIEPIQTAGPASEQPPPAHEAAPPEIPDQVGPPAPTDHAHPHLPEKSDPGVKAGTWRGGIEGGVSGSEGNTKTGSLRFGVMLKREAETMETSLDASVLRVTEQSRTTASQAEANAQNEWLFKGSPWGFFVRGRAEYDQFQDWDWRLSAYSGPSYAFIRDAKTTLRGRIGLGGSYEFGGEDDHLKPEGLLGFDLAHRLNHRQELYVSADYLPSLADYPQFRVDAKAGWRIVIDPESKMSLRIGVQDRYDSSPGPDKDRSDFEYFMTIGWEF